MVEEKIKIKEIRKSYIPKELAKLMLKPSNDWKYATTVIREMRALNSLISFFAKDRVDTLSSPASPYPERHNILPRDKVKPRRKE
jgi:hypothetical protein